MLLHRILFIRHDKLPPLHILKNLYVMFTSFGTLTYRLSVIRKYVAPWNQIQQLLTIRPMCNYTWLSIVSSYDEIKFSNKNTLIFILIIQNLFQNTRVILNKFTNISMWEIVKRSVWESSYIHIETNKSPLAISSLFRYTKVREIVKRKIQQRRCPTWIMNENSIDIF